MFFPLSDDDRLLHKSSYVTNVLLVLNIAVYFLLQGGAEFTYGWAAVPYELTNGVDLVGPQQIQVSGQTMAIPHEPGPPLIWLTVLSAMFMHGGLMHLGGNLLYLWIFGDNVEHRFGHLPFLAFYLASGVAATIAQVAMAPESVVPTLGASGAIAGVLGAYLVLFPRNRVNSLFFIWVISLPAVVAIGAWIVMQFVSGWGSLVAPDATAGGVAYAAHIGGFITGAVLAMVLRVYIKEERPQNVFAIGDPKRKRMW